MDGAESEPRELEGGWSKPWRVDEALVERMAGASTEELLQMLENGTAEEKRQAAIELGDRGEQRAFGPLVELLSCADTSVGDGAALGLEQLNDPQAVQPILDAIRGRSRSGELSTVLVFAVTELDPRQAVWELAELVQRGSMGEATHAGAGLRDIWDELEKSEQEALRDSLRRRLEGGEMEEWRADWIDEIVSEGGWSPEERAQYRGEAEAPPPAPTPS